jgi:hypothetical protein
MTKNYVHLPEWKSCVKGVKASGSHANPYAVCTAQLGREGTLRRRR